MKKTLIFLHGGPGFQDYLEPYFHDLRRSFACHFYSQLQGPAILLEDLIQQLAQKVDTLVEPILVGHSWGGVLATEFALRYPEKLGGLVLMCTALSSEHWLAYRQDLQELNLQNAGPEEIFLVPEDGDQGRNLLKNSWASFSEETFQSLNETYIKNFDLTQKLHLINTKILNIYAERDLRIPQRIAKSLRSFNSAIVDHPIPQVGHFPFLQAEGREGIYRVFESSFADN